MPSSLESGPSKRTYPSVATFSSVSNKKAKRFDPPHIDSAVMNSTSHASTSTSTSSPSNVLSISHHFTCFRDEIDEHNDRRERLIKTSRDVTALSKKVIFLLHRFDIRDFANFSTTPSSKTRKLFQEAEQKLQDIVNILRQTAIDEGLGTGTENVQDGEADNEAKMERVRAYRYERNIGGGLEEFIEALSFYHYLRTATIISLSEIQDLFRKVPVSETCFYSSSIDTTDSTTQASSTHDLGSNIVTVPTSRYLLGLSDLTGELMRFATNAVGQGDVAGVVVKQVLGLTRQLRDQLEPFIPLVGDLRSKQNVTNQSMRKIENILYAITVRSAEYGSDPEALQEMVRRTLAASSSSNPSGDDNNDY